MKEGINRVTLLGNLGADPELKVTRGGTSILKLRVATTTRYMDKSSEWQERTEWHSVTVWGRQAEGLNKFLAKGHSVYVEGELHTSSYEDRDGNKRYRTEINASKVIVVGGGGSSRQAPPVSAPAQRQAPEEPAPADAPGFSDDDIPF